LVPPFSGARFVTLADGSTAFQVSGGWRLKLDLKDLPDGGDSTRAERERLERRNARSQAKRKSRMASAGDDGWGIDASDTGWDFLAGGGGSWGKPPKIGSWTVTLDMKLADGAQVPHEGISLLHTALVHAEETKGRTKVSTSSGEAMINCDGGVGQLGTFGDVSKARVEPGKWHRVVISFHCATQPNEKGELRTWVDTVPGCVLKSDEVTTPSRFELDTEHLFLFSSTDAAMMPGNILLRSVRVEQAASDDKSVLADRARDKYIDKLNEEHIKKVDKQRAGLSLAPLFSKPRPIWATPALVGTFGDAYIEATGLDGASCLAWSFSVLNHALQRTLRRAQTRDILTSFSAADFGTVSDMLHVLTRSAPVFKQMARLLKNPTQNQLMTFLRRVKKITGKISVGDSVLLPTIVEGQELLLMLSRTTERYFDVVVIATNPETSLRYHAVNAARSSHIEYRTALVLNRIEKKVALDDVFWAATFNLTARGQNADVTGDLKRFYDLLLPFLTSKPLEQSLIEAEEISLSAGAAETQQTESGEAESDSSTKPSKSGLCGAWRLPQKSATAYVRCVFEAVNFLLTSRGALSDLKASQVQLALQVQMVDMISNDLAFVHPEDSGRRVCEIALSTLSAATVSLSDRFSTATAEAATTPAADEAAAEQATFVRTVPELVCKMVSRVASTLAAVADNTESLPPLLDLGAQHVHDTSSPAAGGGDETQSTDTVVASAETNDDAGPPPNHAQFRDLMSWDVDENSPDPGQAVTLRKYEAVNMLLIAERAKTREEAIEALRLCDEYCVMISNQEHCVKNPKFLVAALIEHVLVQVVATPKPRAVPWMDAKARARAERVTKRRAEQSVRRAEEKARRTAEWVAFKSSSSGSKQDAAAKRRMEAAAAEAEAARQNAREVLDSLQEQHEPGSAPIVKGSAAKEPDESVEGAANGKDAEEAATQQSCYWDQDINAELQVELLLCLRRLSDHFAAAAMSIQHSRSFDALCMVVPGLIAVLSDSILRRLASDRPSKFTGVLLGLNAGDGRRLGFPGFGISVGSFAEQTETMEVHNPELSVARTAILDYFSSPDQRRLDKIFDWEADFVLRPTRNCQKMLRHICRSLAWTSVAPHILLLDQQPNRSLLFKQFPEMRAFRDIAMWWK
jgi:hypothetical protein